MRAHTTKAHHGEIWDQLEAGESLTDIVRAIGKPLTTVRDFVVRHGGKRPQVPTEWSERRLSLADREEISRDLAAGNSFRTIAVRIERVPSTVSREANANGGRHAYRAVDADASIPERAKRPRPTRLGTTRRRSDSPANTADTEPPSGRSELGSMPTARRIL